MTSVQTQFKRRLCSLNTVEQPNGSGVCFLISTVGIIVKSPSLLKRVPENYIPYMQQVLRLKKSSKACPLPPKSLKRKYNEKVLKYNKKVKNQVLLQLNDGGYPLLLLESIFDIKADHWILPDFKTWYKMGFEPRELMTNIHLQMLSNQIYTKPFVGLLRIQFENSIQNFAYMQMWMSKLKIFQLCVGGVLELSPLDPNHDSHAVYFTFCRRSNSYIFCNWGECATLLRGDINSAEVQKSILKVRNLLLVIEKKKVFEVSSVNLLFTQNSVLDSPLNPNRKK